MAPKATTEEYAYFLQNDPRSKQVLESAGLGANLKALLAGVFSSGDEGAAKSLAANPEIKSAIDRIIEKAAADAATKGTEGKKAADFKGPEGFSNVIGVGPNPVLEAMAQQTEIAMAQLAELQKISGSTPGSQGDFTKGTQSK